MKRKKIIYSSHLKNRLKLRKIGYPTPIAILEKPDERFYDIETNCYIAVKKLEYYGKQRDIMISYNDYSDKIVIVTIHPLKQDQKSRRISSGRWRKYEE